MAASMCFVNFARRAPMSNLLRFQRLRPSTIHSEREYSQTESLVNQAEPQYPPIPLPEDCKEELIRTASEPVLAAETPAEMIYALTKQYTWNYKIHPFGLHNDFSSFFKHITKTEVVEGFPDQVQSLIESDTVKSQTEQLSDVVQDIILNGANTVYRHKQDDVFRNRDVNRQMCTNLISNLIAHFSSSCAHLMDADVDFDVDVKSFWPRGSHKFYQYDAKPLLTVRTKDPLGKVIIVFYPRSRVKQESQQESQGWHVFCHLTHLYMCVLLYFLVNWPGNIISPNKANDLSTFLKNFLKISLMIQNYIRNCP